MATNETHEPTAQLFATLYELTGSAAMLDHNDEVEQVGVWVDGDLIGSGDSEVEALEDAIATARRWEKS